MIGRLRVVAAALVALLLLPATLSAAVPAIGRPVPSISTGSTGSAPAARELVTSYAQREAADKGLDQFEGGSAGVYIGGSTLGIVLLIVILIIIF